MMPLPYHAVINYTPLIRARLPIFALHANCTVLLLIYNQWNLIDLIANGPLTLGQIVIYMYK